MCTTFQGFIFLQWQNSQKKSTMFMQSFSGTTLSVCVCVCVYAYLLISWHQSVWHLGILIRRRSQTLVLILAQNCICLKTRSDHVLPIVITPQQEWYVCFHCSHWYERGIVFKLRWWHSSNFIIHLNLQTWQQDPSTKGMFSVFLSITLESYFSEI